MLEFNEAIMKAEVYEMELDYLREKFDAETPFEFDVEEDY